MGTHGLNYLSQGILTRYSHEEHQSPPPSHVSELKRGCITIHENLSDLVEQLCIPDLEFLDSNPLCMDSIQLES